jgi:hypothetical protein
MQRSAGLRRIRRPTPFHPAGRAASDEVQVLPFAGRLLFAGPNYFRYALSA